MQMMLLQNGLLMGGTLSSFDQFRDLRFNVDGMTYEVCSCLIMRMIMMSLCLFECCVKKKQQLLELGDKIGYVNTGLNEKQIKTCLRKVKPFNKDTPLEDRKCSICQVSFSEVVSLLRYFQLFCNNQPCSLKNGHVFVCRQEDYEAKDEVGKLRCGHRYHISCVKQWLLRKNCCPVCKTMPCVSKS